MVILLGEFQGTGNYFKRKVEENIILIHLPLCQCLFCLWGLFIDKGCVKPVQQE